MSKSSIVEKMIIVLPEGKFVQIEFKDDGGNTLFFAEVVKFDDRSKGIGSVDITGKTPETLLRVLAWETASEF
jgi:hypothetical protein